MKAIDQGTFEDLPLFGCDRAYDLVFYPSIIGLSLNFWKSSAFCILADIRTLEDRIILHMVDRKTCYYLYILERRKYQNHSFLIIRAEIVFIISSYYICKGQLHDEHGNVLKYNALYASEMLNV